MVEIPMGGHTMDMHKSYMFDLKARQTQTTNQAWYHQHLHVGPRKIGLWPPIPLQVCLYNAMSLYLEENCLTFELKSCTVYEMLEHTSHDTGKLEAYMYWSEAKTKTTNQAWYHQHLYAFSKKNVIGMWPPRTYQKTNVYTMQYNCVGRLLLDLRIEMLHHLRDGRAQRPW